MVEFQCAVAARERDEPLFATASQVRRWLLIEVRGAWGRDAVADSDLARYVQGDWSRRLQAARFRVIAIRRDLDRSSQDALQMFHVESGGPLNRGFCRRRHVSTLHAAATVAAELADGDTGHGWQPHHEPLILVCTNGRHDACCATFGRPLTRVLRQRADGDNVWECSHIGGDRFAANLVILPEGLYFGRCDASSATWVLDAYERGEIHLDQYRGRSVFGFYEQAADFFVRRELGLTNIDAVTGLRRVGDSPGVFAVEVVDDGRQRTLEVRVDRTERASATALTCTGPTGQRVPSYELISINDRR